MRHTFFISDLHLSEDHPHLTQLFQHFLSHYAQSAEAIYILGDFFELWIGDDALTTYHHNILHAIKQITQRGTSVYFMPGNRDFLIGETFAKESGCKLLADPTVINLYGHTILLKHGDDLCLNDKAHLYYRRLSHHRWVKKIFLSLPLAWRNKIARLLRETSQRKHHNFSKVANTTMTRKRQDEDYVSKAIIPQLLSQHKASLFIHGHTHMPVIHYTQLKENNPKLRIVLSDWGDKGNYLRIEPSGTVQLNYFTLV